MLKALNYDKPWMAWIPFANYWAFAEVASGGQSQMKVLNMEVPTILMELWWLIMLVLMRVPHIGGVLGRVLQVICLGTCFIKIYAMMDGKSENEVAALGYISGLLPIIAWIKFLAYKGPQLDYHNSPAM